MFGCHFGAPTQRSTVRTYISDPTITSSVCHSKEARQCFAPNGPTFMYVLVRICSLLYVCCMIYVTHDNLTLLCVNIHTYVPTSVCMYVLYIYSILRWMDLYMQVGDCVHFFILCRCIDSGCLSMIVGTV